MLSSRVAWLFSWRQNCYQTWLPSALSAMSVGPCNFASTDVHCLASSAPLRPLAVARALSTSAVAHSPPVRNFNLMRFPVILGPSLVKSIRNFFLVNFIVRPYFDNNFTSSSFVRGAKQAIQVISSRLSTGKADSLMGLVTSEVVDEVRRNLPFLDVTLRHKLNFECANIFSLFLYEIGVIMQEDESNRQSRWLEVTVCAFINKNVNSGSKQPVSPFLELNLDDVVVCNIRFIRDYSKGVEDCWTVNAVNYFQPLNVRGNSNG